MSASRMPRTAAGLGSLREIEFTLDERELRLDVLPKSGGLNAGSDCLLAAARLASPFFELEVDLEAEVVLALDVGCGVGLAKSLGWA